MMVADTGSKPANGPALTRVVVITVAISVLGTVLIPILLSSQKAAREADALASLHELVIAQDTFRSRQSPPAYATSLRALSGLINQDLARGAKGGYIFLAGPADAATYSYVCIPAKVGATGDRSFFVDQTGIIRMSESGPATSSSPPLR